MLQRDTGYINPYADAEALDTGSTDPAPLHPTLAAYFKSKKDQQDALDAANETAQTQQGIGLGQDVASLAFNSPTKQHVYFQHYNDTSAPKMTEAYQPKANGDALRKEAEKTKAEGKDKAARIGADFDAKNKVDNQVRDQGRQDVQDAQTATKFDQSNTEFDHKQSRQAGDDAFTDATRTNAQAGFDDAAQGRDPQSQKSRDFRKFVGTVAPDLAKGLGNMSYEDASKTVPGMTNAYEARLSRQEKSQQSHEDKTNKDQNDAYLHMRKDLESFRGNAAAQQASKDVLSADKTLAMVKSKPPEQFTTQDLSLLAGEMAKIATGGVPTEHGIHNLMPSNLQTKMAEMQNFLTSKPTDAQAGAYIRANMKYVEEMQATAGDTLKTYRHNLAKGYKSKVRPEDFQEAANDYGFGESAAPAKGSTDTPATSAAVHGADLP